MNGIFVKHILVANHHLDKVGGTESYTYAMVEELVKREYQVEYFTFFRGEVSRRLEQDLSIRFMSRKKYDLILANHNTCVNYLFDKGFIMQTCHGVFPELEQPSPNADAYVSISEEVKKHLQQLGYTSRVILNGINLERYRPVQPLHSRLSCVLSLCHSAMANTALEKACEGMGAKLIIVDKYNNPVWEVEQKINEADLVVGVGRSAYEAMACGRPVIIFDHRDYYPSCGDGYVRDMIGDSIRNNCSGRYSNRSYTAPELERELRKYDPADGAFFRKFAEDRLDIRNSITEYLEHFRDAWRNVTTVSIAYLRRMWLCRKWRKKLKKKFGDK